VNGRPTDGSTGSSGSSTGSDGTCDPLPGSRADRRAAPSGSLNAITDVDGVKVGFTTLSWGEGPLVVGQGPVRTGVTVVMPHDAIGEHPVFAGCHRLNGNER